MYAHSESFEQVAQTVLEVIGAGFGRTGTMSLQRALEILGFGPCYHFTEVLRRSHASTWLKVLDGKPANWDHIYTGYKATVDWPGVMYYRELADHFPDARVILTVRDPADWHASICAALLPLRGTLVRWLPWTGKLARLTDQVIWQGTFAGRAAEREFAVARFEQHNRKVRESIAADRLLVLDVRDGWPPLCRFLDCEVPDVPFPRTNSRHSIRNIVWLIRGIKLLAVVLLVLLAFALLMPRVVA